MAFPFSPPSPAPSYFRTFTWTEAGQKRYGVHYVGDTVTARLSPLATDPHLATFEAGTNGATLTTADTGALTPYSAVTGAPTYDNTRSVNGSLSMRCGAGGRSFRWGYTPAATEEYIRAYYYFTGYPSTNGTIWRTNVNFASMQTNGKIRISDCAACFGGRSDTTAAAIPLNQWIRLEWHMIYRNDGTGTYDFKVFHNHLSSTPTEQLTHTNWYTALVGGGSSQSDITFGLDDGTWPSPAWLDDIGSLGTDWWGTGNPPGKIYDYEVRDFYGNTLQAASCQLDINNSFEVVAPSGGWDPGWYRVYLSGTETDDPLFGDSYGVTNFCVIRDDSNFVTIPDPSVRPLHTSGEDMILKGTMGMQASRIAITTPASPAADIVTAQAMIDTAETYRAVDPTRDQQLIVNFPNTSVDICFLPQTGGPAFQNFAQAYCKDDTIDGTKVFVALSAGTVTGRKIRVYFPNAATLVETYDNITSGAAAETAINGVSAYVKVFSGGGAANGTLVATAIGNTYRTGVISVVDALYPGATRFEGPKNEGTPNAEIAHQMMLFQSYIHAGDPNAIATGPCSVVIYTDNIEPFFAAGGGDYCDELSFHAYNSVAAANINLGRYQWQTLLDLMDSYGLADKPIWQTESTHSLASLTGAFTPRKANQHLMYTMLLEQYGVPDVRDFPWYDISHGFWSYPAFLESSDGALMPQAVLARVRAEETFGRPYVGQVDFGTPGNNIYLGSLYTGDDGTSVVAVLPTCFMDEASVTFTVTGTAGPLTVVDGFGNETSEPLTAGQLTITPTDIPTYVRLPAGASATVHHCHDWPPEGLTNIGPTATSKLLGGQSFPGLSDNGFMTKYDGTTTTPGINTSTHIGMPDTAELTWDTEQTIGRVIAWCGPTYQALSTILDFDVQTWDGADWTTRATVTKPDPELEPLTIKWGDAGANTGSGVETFWDRQWIFDVPLDEAVDCLGVRLYVRDCSWGGAPKNWPAEYGYPFGPDQGNQTLFMSFQEIGVYAPNAAPLAPVVVDDPVASGTTIIGYDVETTDGVWDNDPTSFGYQWQSSDDGTSGWANIGGATSDTLTLGIGLLGKYLRALVTASNDTGPGDPAASNVLGPVVRPTPPPSGGSSPGGSNLPGGTTVYLPRKRARKTGFKRRRM